MHFKRKNEETIIGYAFVTPSIIFLGVFMIWPMFFSLFLSFTKWDLISPKIEIIGLQNFRMMLKNPLFFKVLKNTFIFTLGTLLITMILALILAIVLNQRLRVKGFYRGLIFSPYITPMVVISIVWMWIYNPEYGLANYFLKIIGLPALKWLSDTRWALPAIIILSIWQNMGYYMILYLAGLQSIPASLYEAAEIDGASGFNKFAKITFPLLSPTTFFIMIVSFLNSFQVFDQISVMTEGGPSNSTNVMVYYMYQNAFMFFKVGYASAIAVVIFIILFLITLTQFKMGQKWVFYG
jgi:ABC-type sugar transport system permease subunit